MIYLNSVYLDLFKGKTGAIAPKQRHKSILSLPNHPNKRIISI